MQGCVFTTAFIKSKFRSNLKVQQEGIHLANYGESGYRAFYSPQVKTLRHQGRAEEGMLAWSMHMSSAMAAMAMGLLQSRVHVERCMDRPSPGGNRCVPTHPPDLGSMGAAVCGRRQCVFSEEALGLLLLVLLWYACICV